MALYNPLAGKAPAVKMPSNVGEEVGSWFGVGRKQRPGGLTGGADQPVFQGELQKPIVGGLGDLQMGPPGGKSPTIGPMEIANPYEQANAPGILGGLAGQLQQQTQGNFGPGGSLGQALLQQGLTQNMGAVRSQLASQRGLSPAIAARIAANQTAAMQGQTAQQAGILGLQQQLEAQKQLGAVGGQLSQADIDLRKLKAQTALGIQSANQQAAIADKARTTQLATSILGGGAQVGAAAVGAAHGGRIDGEAPYAGDTPKNDVVSAKLSPGEIVIPRSAAGSKKAAKSFIESLDDWDEEPSYSKVLKARSRK